MSRQPGWAALKLADAGSLALCCKCNFIVEWCAEWAR